ncbi:sulfotransferase family protein [Streptomyces sp. NPDC048659]|uniref:sulfotransferase family protein n=1 Tax=Streptomyces sp. NPDC048659 TaxID=3155489 RepID=UPI00342A0E27
MTLRVVGAGFPRTGTTSLKTALERLLGAPCYHTTELLRHFDHAPAWRDAFKGVTPDWNDLLHGYVAGVDWPFSRFWRELAAANPDALVLLSRRDTPESWYRSMDRTILPAARMSPRARAARFTVGHDAQLPELVGATQHQLGAINEMFFLKGREILTRPDGRAGAIAAYERHLAEVRTEIPAGRLLEWEPSDGWEPLCAALAVPVPVPAEPFPHKNTADEWPIGPAEGDHAGPPADRTT